MAYTAGKGTTLLVFVDDEYVPIPQVTSITPPQLEMGSAETTHLTSAARENIATIPDPGEVSFNLEWDPADDTHELLYSSFQAKTIEAWRITMTDADTTNIDFNGFVMNFGVDELNVDSIVAIPATIKVTGMPTITSDDED